MTRSSALLPCLALVLAGLTPTEAWAGLRVAGNPKVAFYATGSPGFLDIEGITKEISAADDGGTITFTVPVAGIDTGIELRDHHMKEKYLEVEKYPSFLLTFSKTAVTWPAAPGESTKGTVAASFSAHGAPAPVQVTYSLKKTKDGYTVKASFPFDVTDHGIAIPSYLGVTVDAKMRAEVTLDLVDAP